MANEEHAVALTVRLRRDAADALRRGAPPPALQAALAGAALEPMYPGVADPELGTWFTVGGLTVQQAESLGARLRSLGDVESAYVQPRPDPASG